ncbi:MAG: glycosyltransferase, partial [Gammaproteobacteria bacterium]
MNARREDLISAASDGHARVTTVIVTYNSAGTIGATLEALESTASSGFNRCVVVDNDSADNTASLIEQDFPWVTVVRSRENLGFARGCNLGFEKANTPYVLFLNPDAVLSASGLHTLFEFMEDNTDVAVTAPATRVGDSGYQKVGMLTTPGQLLRSALGLPDAYPDSAPIAFGE